MNCSRFISRWSFVAFITLLFPQTGSAVTLSTMVQTAVMNPGIDLEFNYGGFLKFDTRLGTLKNVILKVNSLSVGGSFSFNQGSTGSSTIYAYYTDIIFLAGLNNNNTANNGLIVDYDIFPAGISLAVVNQVMPKMIARRNSVTFNFDSNQNLLLVPTVVLNLSSQKDIDFYRGDGISFAPAFTSITQFMVSASIGGRPIRDYSNLTSTMSLALHYDYIPAMIPESCDYGRALGFMSLAVLLASRFRKRTTAG